QQVFRKVIKVAAGNSPVLILGEKGTGKQLLAEQIHGLSARKDASFDSIVCSSFSELDLDAELFGENHAAEARRGRFQSNDGGTLYLADVSVMPMSVQGKLVRFLEEGLIQPPGTGHPLSLDLRVVTSNSEPMNYLVQNGRFRSDLFYALSACVIELPPLRARVNDIPELVDFFLGRYDVQIAGEAVELLMNYPWPGNID